MRAVRQRVLFNLHRKLVPLAALKDKAQTYVDSGLIQQEMAERVVRVIESERGDSNYINDVEPGEVNEPGRDGDSLLLTRLSPEQMSALLEKRVGMMRQGQVRDDGGMDEGVTDQYRVYFYIISALEQGQLLRLIVQASAGTGSIIAR